VTSDERSTGDDEKLKDGEAVVNFTHDTLRENLHLAVNSVLSARFQDQRVREALTAELLRTLDAVVDDHISAEELGRGMPVAAGAGSGAPTAAPGSVEDAMAALRERVQTAFAGGRPGIRQGAAGAMKLAPSVVESLKTFVHDEAAFSRAQQAAQIVLGRYLHPVIAGQVVSFAASVVRRASHRNPKEAAEAEPEGGQFGAEPKQSSTSSSSPESESTQRQ
jgi:hypothetical protein